MNGDKVGDLELIREKSQKYLYGASFGGAIIKNKLFFFVNGEYEDNVTAGPKSRARLSDSDDWGSNTANVNRPTVGKMDEIRNYFIDKYDYDPGRYQGYSIKTPAYKIMARLDWNINDNNKLNFRLHVPIQKIIVAQLLLFLLSMQQISMMVEQQLPKDLGM